MKLYCILFLLASILKFSDSCLVIQYSEPPACACKTLKLDIWNIAENHGEPYLMYNSVMWSTIKSPEIIVEDCFVQVYCEDGADLYIFDTGKGAKIGDYGLDGFCDPYQQAWQVDTGNGIEQYKELKAVCVLKNKCSPTDPAAFFFAYSADLDKWAFTDIYIQHSKIDNGTATKFAIAATVRFDTKVKEDIVFHESDTYFDSRLTGYQYMLDQAENPPQRFESWETGSDILDVLERFVDSNHPLVCGSMVLIAMRRSPNEVDISRIVEKLRENQITVIIASLATPPSYGLHPETMYDLAAKTNGFCALSPHHVLSASQTAPNVVAPYIVYSLNLKVSGTGTMVLPTILLQDTYTVHLSVAVQSTCKAKSFQSLKFSFRNKELGASGSVEKTREELRYSYEYIRNSFKVSNFLLAEPTFFEFTLDYNYTMEDTIQIRLISERGIGHWFPYQD